MTTATDRLLLRLEWQVLRRIDGRLLGSYRTAFRGVGLDFAGLRDYVESDDARHIDWNATARLDEPQIRQYLEDRELTVWLVLDRSTSMNIGTPGHGKGDVLTELALILARLFGRGGNRVGAVLYGAGPTLVVPPRTGRAQALRIGHELGRTQAAPAKNPRDRARTRARRRDRADAAGATTDLAQMIEAVSGLARRRSLIVIVSDFIGTGDWSRPLLRLTQRHEVVALRVVDGADDALPEVGLIVVEDAETSEQLIVDSADPLFRQRFRDGVDERDAALHDGMRRAGVPLHRIETERDLVTSLVEVAAGTQWRRTQGARR